MQPPFFDATVSDLFVPAISLLSFFVIDLSAVEVFPHSSLSSAAIDYIYIFSLLIKSSLYVQGVVQLPLFVAAIYNLSYIDIVKTHDFKF